MGQSADPFVGEYAESRVCEEGAPAAIGLHRIGWQVTVVERLCAEDLDWSYGSGSPVYGAAQDLLLLVFGRRLPGGRLRGEASSRFTTA
ncbi:hypothetical protein ACIQAM_12595 [Streptomyces goshikiensis]|uniref:hypothetical protein n=1 Tax=Streptomyces goshikiensis TaxID=1942 RepID=UPI00382EF2A5